MHQNHNLFFNILDTCRYFGNCILFVFFKYNSIELKYFCFLYDLILVLMLTLQTEMRLQAEIMVREQLTQDVGQLAVTIDSLTSVCLYSSFVKKNQHILSSRYFTFINFYIFDYLLSGFCWCL